MSSVRFLNVFLILIITSACQAPFWLQVFECAFVMAGASDTKPPPNGGQLIKFEDEDFQGHLFYYGSLPDSKVQVMNNIQLVIIVGSAQRPTMIPLGPKVRIWDMASALECPRVWSSKFVAAWHIATRFLRRGGNVVVVPGQPSMWKEAPHVLACIRAKLYGSKPEDSLDRIKHDKTPMAQRTEKGIAYSIFVPKFGEEDWFASKTKPQTA